MSVDSCRRSLSVGIFSIIHSVSEAPIGAFPNRYHCNIILLIPGCRFDMHVCRCRCRILVLVCIMRSKLCEDRCYTWKKVRTVPLYAFGKGLRCPLNSHSARSISALVGVNFNRLRTWSVGSMCDIWICRIWVKVYWGYIYLLNGIYIWRMCCTIYSYICLLFDVRRIWKEPSLNALCVVLNQCCQI